MQPKLVRLLDRTQHIRMRRHQVALDIQSATPAIHILGIMFEKAAGRSRAGWIAIIVLDVKRQADAQRLGSIGAARVGGSPDDRVLSTRGAATERAHSGSAG